MIKNLLKTALLVPLLTACVSTIDTTIPLSSQFEQNSALISLETPTWRIPDSVFNKSLGEHTIKNAYTSWQTADSKLVDQQRNSSFIDYLLLGDNLSLLVKEYEVNSNQRFSFDLTRDGVTAASSKCELFALFMNKVTTTGRWSERGSSSTSNTGDRLKTFLVCDVSHNGQHWQLTFNAAKGEKTKVELKTNNQSYRIEAISQSISLVKGSGGIEQRPMPSWVSHNSGLAFYSGTEQLAAFSFVGKAKIWLKSDLPTQTKELLLAVNYSLTLFNWLDSEWNEGRLGTLK